LLALGVDAIWLCRSFPSRWLISLAYDIADYTGIDPLFGGIEAFDDANQPVHASGYQVILDSRS